MKLTIKTSGGIGGFGLSPKPTVVEVEKLAGALRERARSMFAPAHLKSLAAKSGNPNAADGITYEVTVTGDNGETHRADLSDNALPPEALDLLDAIKAAAD